MAAYDTKADRESHSRAGLAFGGAERIKETRFYFRTHAGSSVANGEDYAIAGFLCRQPDFAPGGHGVDGVIDHVDEHFAQFHGIALDEGFAVGVQRKANRAGVDARLPARPAISPASLRSSTTGDIFKLTAGSLAGKVLNTRMMWAILGALDDHQTLDCFAGSVLRRSNHAAHDSSECVIDAVGDAE